MYKFNLKTFNIASRLIDISSIHIKNYKEELLGKFIQKHNNLAEQGSDEWHEIRKYSIGGSEMAVVKGKNGFTTIEELIARKVGFTHFNTNIACRWGNLFESVTNQIAEIMFNTTISETGSLPGVIQEQRYSPDGLGVVTFKCEMQTDKSIQTVEHCIVLFEYKAPYSSIPKGVIPKYYIPQVLTGLCSIPLADFAIFISNMYRKCSLSDLADNTNYDTEFHTGDAKKRIHVESPLALGMILFYQTDAQYDNFYNKYKNMINETDELDLSMYDSDSDDDGNIFSHINTKEFIKKKFVAYEDNIELYKFIHRMSKSDDKPRDFGMSYYRDFNDILTLRSENMLSVQYCDPCIMKKYNENEFIKAQQIEKKYDVDKYIDEYKNIAKSQVYDGKKIIGYLPWKMFKSDIIYKKREEEYVINSKEQILKVVSIINQIHDAPSDEIKYQIFKSHFPNTKILQREGLDNSHLMSMLPRM